MACETRLKPRQTISERAAEVRRAVDRISAAIASGRVKVIVSKAGAVALEGLDDTTRDGVTDACAYRKIMTTGSAMARMAIARAEQLAGRMVDRAVIGAAGGHTHSHDGGLNWHKH